MELNSNANKENSKKKPEGKQERKGIEEQIIKRTDGTIAFKRDQDIQLSYKIIIVEG